MKKIALFALLATLSLPVRAEPASRLAALKTWFQHLKEGLADSSVSDSYQRGGSVAAIAAVRGAQQDGVDAKTPAFKSSEGMRKAKAAKQERAELSAAVELILNGKVADGEGKLDAFVKAHPKSALIADARRARAKAKELEGSSETR